jgi:hypothetical protein
MERQVSVHVQRWEPMPGGKAKVKIMEKAMNLQNIVHEGEFYRTAKKLTRGRYIMVKAPLPPGMAFRRVDKKKPPKTAPSPTDREPLQYQPEAV